MADIAGIESDVLFQLKNVPVHSCELIGSAAEARSCPAGAMELAIASSSGLISNRRFDTNTQTFTGRYEETQAFSNHFGAYVRNLAERLIADHGLQGKRILEIGCGKGYFLVELCRLAGATGIGIDPSAAPERFPELAETQVTFLRERLAAHHDALAPDFVLCRHTLEHIADPVAFLRLVHRTFGGRRDVPFYLDVPDATRILREGAFWDIYYEHCHYFTPNSLTAILAAAGFSIVEIHTEYDDQFLCATAAPAPPDAELQPQRTLEVAAPAFQASLQAQIVAWEAWFVAHAGQTVAIWGAGSKAVGFLTTLGIRAEVSHVVDINPHKAGTFIPGTAQPIVGPSALTEIRPDHIVIMNPVYSREIAAAVGEMGLSPTLWTVGKLPLRPLAI